MEKRKKRTIFVKTPYIKYEEQPDPVPELNCKSTETNPISDLYQFQIPSHRLLEKLTKDLIKFEKLDIAPKSSLSSYQNKNFFNEDSSKIIIRPKISQNQFSPEQNKQMLYRRSSCGVIEKNSCFGSSLNKVEQTQRARKFFLQPFCKTPDLKPKKMLERLKQKIRLNNKRLVKLKS